MDTPASTYYNPSGAGFSSDRMDWRTPPELFRALDAEFHFTLDAAANEANLLCDRYYTAEDSAFWHSWDGEHVFCNPPYGRDAAKWIEKCAREGGGCARRRPAAGSHRHARVPPLHLPKAERGDPLSSRTPALRTPRNRRAR